MKKVRLAQSRAGDYVLGTMMNQRDTTHPAEELKNAMERIYGYRMTTTSGGNLSILDNEGSVWITPARIDKGGLKREDIVEIRGSGEIRGLHKPSSEYPFHHRIYETRTDIRAIIHAHPVALVAFSICGNRPDTRMFPQGLGNMRGGRIRPLCTTRKRGPRGEYRP